MSWIDIGVNLTDPRLEQYPVIERALNADIKQMIITGTSLKKSVQALSIANEYPYILSSTAGVHPHHAKEFSDQTRSELETLAKQNQVVAIGECGLDFNRNFSTQTQQIHAFEQQLQLACELGLPVFLHERDAFDTQIKLLTQYRDKLVGGVAHCFTGNQQQMKTYLDLDLYIGITGWVCDIKRGEDLRHAVASLPLEKVMLETDAPYLRPKTLPNDRKLDKGNNEPAYLPYVAKELANLMCVDLATLQKASCNNAHRLFKLPKSDSNCAE